MLRNTSHNIAVIVVNMYWRNHTSIYIYINTYIYLVFTIYFFFTSNNDKIWTWITIILCHRFPSMTYCSQISEILKSYQNYLICINYINLKRLVIIKLLVATLIARKNYNLCDNNTYYIVCMVTDNQQVVIQHLHNLLSFKILSSNSRLVFNLKYLKFYLNWSVIFQVFMS